jgi:hypothetical protein
MFCSYPAFFNSGLLYLKEGYTHWAVSSRNSEDNSSQKWDGKEDISASFTVLYFISERFKVSNKSLEYW